MNAEIVQRLERSLRHHYYTGHLALGDAVKDPVEGALLRAWRLMSDQERDAIRVLFARMAQSDAT